jgi:methyl-accepting chemotaxis protein
MEKAFIEEMAKFKDVKYIRVVSSDGTIYKSSIEGEWGKIIKEPDISKVIRARKEIIKDQIFQEEKIKLIIYPGYQDKTIWVAFTLKGIEKVIRTMWIRDISLALGGLILIILILFTILRRIIDPLRKMRAVCEEIGKGNLNIKMEVKSKTEIGDLADTFNEMIKDLEKSHRALEESKKILEIKVAARTKELKELVEQRETVIKERTKELQKKIEELERFHRLAVGRELRMIELKKEIKKLKKELEKFESQK